MTNMARWQYTISASDGALDGVDRIALLSAVEGRVAEIRELAATLAERTAHARDVTELRHVLADLNLASALLRDPGIEATGE